MRIRQGLAIQSVRSARVVEDAEPYDAAFPVGRDAHSRRTLPACCFRNRMDAFKKTGVHHGAYHEMSDPDAAWRLDIGDDSFFINCNRHHRLSARFIEGSVFLLFLRLSDIFVAI